MTKVRTAAFWGVLALAAMAASEAGSQQTQPVQPQGTTPDPAQPRGYTYDKPAVESGTRPSFSFEFGKWGMTPSNFPYANTWSHRGKAEDPACNMPSSPCWNEDRE